MLKQIFKDSLQNLKKNWLMSVMLCLIVILSTALISSLMFIPFFGETLTLMIIIPFLLVPIIFAIQMLHFGLREGVAPCGKLFFRFFRAYFSPGIMGVYRMINTILFAMLAEMGVSVVVTGILYGVIGSNPEYAEIFNRLADLLTANGSEQEIEALLSSPEVRVLAFSSYIPGFGVAAMVAFLSSSFNSLSLYFKVRNPMVNPAYSQRMYIFAKNQIRGQLIKEYWGLNWPIYVLFTIGFATGVSIAYFSEDLSYTFGMFLGLIVGLGLAMLYLPIFTSNLEQIYLSHHEQTFAHAPEIFANRMQDSLNAQMQAMQEQMEQMKKQQDMMNQHKDDDQNNDNISDVDDTSSSNKIETAEKNNVIDAEVKDDDTKDNQ